MTDRELMQMALDALESIERLTDGAWQDPFAEERKALRDRLAQPEPEPVAWMWHEVKWKNGERQSVAKLSETKTFQYAKPLYTAPPHYDSNVKKREWVGLTDEEYEQFSQWTHIEIIERIVSLLKEKNT